jgi:hypothetical protein
MDFDRSLRSLQEAVIYSLLRRRGVAVRPSEVKLALQDKRPREAFAALVARPPIPIVPSNPAEAASLPIDRTLAGRFTQVGSGRASVPAVDAHFEESAAAPPSVATSNELHGAQLVRESVGAPPVEVDNGLPIPSHPLWRRALVWLSKLWQ